MSRPYFMVICETCKVAYYPPNNRGDFWTALEDFIVQYHRDKGCICNKWMDEIIYSGDDGKLYQEGGYGQNTVLIEDWWRYGQITMPDTEWRNWPERSAKCQRYLFEQGLVDKDGVAIKQPYTEENDG